MKVVLLSFIYQAILALQTSNSGKSIIYLKTDLPFIKRHKLITQIKKATLYVAFFICFYFKLA